MIKRFTNKSLNLFQEISKALSYRGIYRKYKNFTMIAENTYIKNLLVADYALNKKGCIVECGVWRGGMIAGIADLLGDTRKYYLFDSFEGLPPARQIDGQSALNWQENKDASNYHDNNSASIEFSQQAMKISKATEFEIIKGWFEQTLPNFKPSEPILILRLDADWFDSTLKCLECLHPYLADDAIIILDDYYVWDGCSRAVHHFLANNDSTMRVSRLYKEICVVHASNNFAI